MKQNSNLRKTGSKWKTTDTYNLRLKKTTAGLVVHVYTK
jgi:hypothetical protein